MYRFKHSLPVVLLRLLGLVFALAGQMAGTPAVAQGQTVPHQPAAETETPATRPMANREIFVASNGWHSAIFVARAAIPRDALPMMADFPKAVFLGFGWGDAAYFPDRDPGFVTLLNAAFQATPSVLHVTGLSSHPRDAFPSDEVVGLTLSGEGFRNLLAYLRGAFAGDAATPAKFVAPGLHDYSKFYRANGEFHVFNNCNSWTARGLAAAGIAIEPGTIFRAEALMEAVRELAK